MDPQQIRHREYWGIGTITASAFVTLTAMAAWLFAGGSFAGVAIGVLVGAVGLFIIATLPDSEGPDSESY